MAPDSLGNLSRMAGKSLAQWKTFFFSSRAVQLAAGKATVKALSRFGAVVRRTAQTSMRYRKGVSPPGTPPSAHKSKKLAALKKLGKAKHNGALLRELLFFAYDPATKSVVVGPLGFKTRGTPIPALHEFGGERQAGKRESMLSGKGKTATVVRLDGKTLRYPPRPFMAPALAKAKAKFAEAFKGTITR